MRALAEQLWHAIALMLGRALRASRYASVRMVHQDGHRMIRKHRAFYAPLLIACSRPLMWVLRTGVTVLPQRSWAERERVLYQKLYAATIHSRGRVLFLPVLAGDTLAEILENPRRTKEQRSTAIVTAAHALSAFHAMGCSHGDAMAENVMVDLDGGTARWFDFETVHAPWVREVRRRADDLRALLATCVLRTAPADSGATVHAIIRAYGDAAVGRAVAEDSQTLLRPALIFHLGQAPLTLQQFRDIRRALS